MAIRRRLGRWQTGAATPPTSRQSAHMHAGGCAADPPTAARPGPRQCRRVTRPYVPLDETAPPGPHRWLRIAQGRQRLGIASARRDRSHRRAALGRQPPRVAGRLRPAREPAPHSDDRCRFRSRHRHAPPLRTRRSPCCRRTGTPAPALPGPAPSCRLTQSTDGARKGHDHAEGTGATVVRQPAYARKTRRAIPQHHQPPKARHNVADHAHSPPTASRARAQPEPALGSIKGVSGNAWAPSARPARLHSTAPCRLPGRNRQPLLSLPPGPVRTSTTCVHAPPDKPRRRQRMGHSDAVHMTAAHPVRLSVSTRLFLSDTTGVDGHNVLRVAQLYLPFQPVPELVMLTDDRSMTAAQDADSPHAIAAAAQCPNRVFRDAGERHEARVDLAMTPLQFLDLERGAEGIALTGPLHLTTTLSYAKAEQRGNAERHWGQADQAARRIGRLQPSATLRPGHGRRLRDHHEQRPRPRGSGGRRGHARRRERGWPSCGTAVRSTGMTPRAAPDERTWAVQRGCGPVGRDGAVTGGSSKRQITVPLRSSPVDGCGP